MLGVTLALLACAVVAAAVYLGRERLGVEGLGMMLLRTAGLGALVLLLINPTRTVRVAGGPPTVLLDASLSMGVEGGRWSEALDTALSLAGDGGEVLRFGTAVAPLDTTPPADGISRVRAGLTQAGARGGPVIVVTDGELADAAALHSSASVGPTWVVLPRDTVPGAALLEAVVPEQVAPDDSIPIRLTVATWGSLASRSAVVEVSEGERRLLVRGIELPPPPGAAQRRIVLAPGTLSRGDHVLRVRLSAGGDTEPRDDERMRVVTVSDEPAVAVIVDPPGWEGRFLVEALREVTGSAVRGFARPDSDRWVDMRTLEPVPAQSVRTAAQRAALLVLRGSREHALAAGRSGPVWHWPAGSDTLAEFFAGDWYVRRTVPVSPLAGQLAGVAWDSLPPLTGVLPLAPGEGEWTALEARQGRRGAARAVLVGSRVDGRRELTTAGAGLWRWAFRGGAPREAYRAFVAGGVDWLLRSAVTPRAEPLTASRVVQRGIPVAFRWRGADVPDSAEVAIAGDTVQRVTLRFDPDGLALIALEPGAYRWSTAAGGGARGVTVVESYSSEYPPASVMVPPEGTAAGYHVVELAARRQWWLFLVVVLALSGEWAWRQRRGLP